MSVILKVIVFKQLNVLSIQSMYNQIFTCFPIFTKHGDTFLAWFCFILILCGTGRSLLPGLCMEATAAFHSPALCAGWVTMDFLWLWSRRLLCTNQISALTNTASSTMLGPLPCEQRTSVNRRENRECLDGRGDV